jgi:hypothetical protein
MNLFHSNSRGVHPQQDPTAMPKMYPSLLISALMVAAPTIVLAPVPAEPSVGVQKTSC